MSQLISQRPHSKFVVLHFQHVLPLFQWFWRWSHNQNNENYLKTPPPKKIAQINPSNQTPRRCKNFTQLCEMFSPKNPSIRKQTSAGKNLPPKQEEKSINQARKNKSLRSERKILCQQQPLVTEDCVMTTSNVSFNLKNPRNSPQDHPPEDPYPLSAAKRLKPVMSTYTQAKKN